MTGEKREHFGTLSHVDKSCCNYLLFSGPLESFKSEVERMESIVKIRPRGLFMSQAEKIYRKQFDVEFPKDLWDAVSGRSTSSRRGMSSTTSVRNSMIRMRR